MLHFFIWKIIMLYVVDLYAKLEYLLLTINNTWDYYWQSFKFCVEKTCLLVKTFQKYRKLRRRKCYNWKKKFKKLLLIFKNFQGNSKNNNKKEKHDFHQRIFTKFFQRNLKTNKHQLWSEVKKQRKTHHP